MAKNSKVKSTDRNSKRDPIPETFDSIEEMAEFWDTHDSGDYEDCFGEEVEFELEVGNSQLYFPVEKDLGRKLREIARKQGISSETLLNLWVQEKLAQIG